MKWMKEREINWFPVFYESQCQVTQESSKNFHWRKISTFFAKKTEIFIDFTSYCDFLSALPLWNANITLWSNVLGKYVSFSAYLSKLFTLVTSCQGQKTFASEGEDGWKTSNMRFKTHMLKETKRILSS